MIILAFITGITIISLIILCLQWGKEEGEAYKFGMYCGLTMAALFVLEIICINESISRSHPKAINVYQGKTTLEYTIRDGVKIDSIVVFKK
jgi:hypothetical protein